MKSAAPPVARPIAPRGRNLRRAIILVLACIVMAMFYVLTLPAYVLAALACAVGAPGCKLPSPARAVTPVAATFAVTVTIQATCLISVPPLAFGAYAGAALQGATLITITCTDTTPYTIGLSAGGAPGATVRTRNMTAGASMVGYVLTSDAAYEVNWGNTAGTDTIAGTGTGAAQTMIVYGRIAAGQFAAPSTYTDTVTATVSY